MSRKDPKMIAEIMKNNFKSFLIFMLCKGAARHPLEPRGLFLLSVVTKGSKNTLWCKESESAKCPS